MPLHVSSTCAHHHTYRCDDTRGCVTKFWPPDDENMCSKHVEAWNKLIIKQRICASSWLITEINVLFFVVMRYIGKELKRKLFQTSILYLSVSIVWGTSGTQNISRVFSIPFFRRIAISMLTEHPLFVLSFPWPPLEAIPSVLKFSLFLLKTTFEEI